MGEEQARPARAHMVISPRGWGLEPATARLSAVPTCLGLPTAEMEMRAQRNTCDWLPKQFNQEVGAFHGYYDARSKNFAAPQTVNLIAPFQCLAAFDRFQDEKFLDMARRAVHWVDEFTLEGHPMSLVLGGIRDNIKTTQLWTKYTADYVTLNLGLFERSQEERYLANAIHGGRFLMQSQNHGFAPKYDHWHETWIAKGWQSFGRVIKAMLALEELTKEGKWLEWARRWAEYALKLQADDGCFYLINDTYYSSDIAADEIRGLIRVYRRTDEKRFLTAALRFADWHVIHQAADGSWPLSQDRFGEPVTVYKGPGDMPNIGIALLAVHDVTQKSIYLFAAAKAMRYALARQQVPGQLGHYQEDPNTHWGFWSWVPYYDFTMSADQSTHHTRGFWFFLDYMLALPPEKLADIEKELEQPRAQAEPPATSPAAAVAAQNPPAAH